MHRRTQELLGFLDEQRQALRAAVESVPSALAAVRPAPERWSVAEIVEHLTIVETRMTRVFASEVGAARHRLGPESTAGSVLAALDVQRLTNRTRRIVASAAAEPRGELTLAEAWSALERIRGELREAIAASDGLALGDVSAPHPALGSLNMYQWLLFVGGHEARHTLQIRDVLAALTSDVTG